MTGDNLDGLSGEAGGHRFQRNPPSEKRGRIHTSTVTVAVLDPNGPTNAIYLKRSDDDFKIEWFQSLGAGGQNANKHHNCCRLTHLPTGLRQEVKGKSRESNLKQTKAALIKILDQKIKEENAAQTSELRKSQMGSGMRGDKIRTYREQDDTAKDHRNGRSHQYSKIMKGEFDRLW